MFNIFLLLALSSISAATHSLATVRCTTTGICKDTLTGKEFRCMNRKMECCQAQDGLLGIFYAPRGTGCCNGHGIFDLQTHSCENGENLVLRPESVLCPGTTIYHNSKTQVCCSGRSGETSVHLKEDGKVCCGNRYVRNATQGCQATNSIAAIRCVRRRICNDTLTGKQFRCMNRKMECCQAQHGQLGIFYAPRGTACCDGHGMFDWQTHKCEKGRDLVLRDESAFCPGTTIYHNTKTQVCCSGRSGNTLVHLKEDGKVCCGKNYVKTSTHGCCEGTSYNRRTECCKNGLTTAPKRECAENQCEDFNSEESLCCSGKVLKNKPVHEGWACCPNKASAYKTNAALECSNKTRRMEFSGCSRVKEGCTPYNMEKRFKHLKSRASYMYTFHVSRLKGNSTKYLTYKVKFAKQLLGTDGKLKPVKSDLRLVQIPRCGCTERLSSGEIYSVMVKRPVRDGKLLLRGNHYFVWPLRESDIFAKIFD